jgi:DNA repair exonuclease SbcCD ATPase subunit
MHPFFSEYLSPTNPIASGIVTLLQYSFSIWCVGLIVYGLWSFIRWIQMRNNQNIQPLVTARQERDLGREDNEAETDAEKVFQEFCKKSFLERSPIPFLGKPSSITKHLKAIFLAGWDESRLEVSELINHTTSNLFRWNSLFRSVLAVFIVIGLLGTLFGLTDSLKDLSPALKESAVIETPTENSERMTQALGNLMDHIKGAFAPSIWGIIFTIAGVILYGVYLQIACHPVKSILERLTLTVWVPQLYPTTSQTLQQSESQMRKGFETAAQFSESVGTVQSNISEFNKSLTQASAITQPLSDSATQINKAASYISTAADVLSKDFTENLNKFSGVLNTGFKEILDKFSKEFASSVTHLTGFQAEIRSLHQQFQEASNQKLDQQTQKLEEQNQNLATTLEVLKNYEKLYVDSCQQIDETLQKFLNETTEASANIEATNREFLEGINATNREWIKEIQSQLKTELTIIQPTLKEELNALTGQLTSDLKEVQRALDERLKALTEQLKFFQLPIEKTADQIEGIIESFTRIMAGVVNDLQSEFQKQNERIEKQNKNYEEQLTGVKNLNESVVNMLNQLDESSKNQKNAVSVLSSNVGELTADTQNLAAAITSFTSDSGALSHSVAAIEKHAGTLGTASQQFVEKVEKADVTPLTANIGRLNTAINEISQNSRTLANAVNTLAKQGSSSGSERKPKRSFFGRIRNRFSRKKTSEQTSAESQSKNEGK